MSDDIPTVVSGPSRHHQKSYLVKRGYRKLDLVATIEAGEQAALQLMASVRWGENWEHSQACPKCGTIAAHYRRKKRPVWTCRESACGYEFSVFSETRLQGTKMAAHKILSILHHFVEAKDSISAREVAGLHNLEHQTMHVMFLKFREALADSMSAEPLLTGFIQADAAYFIKYVRPGNIGTGASDSAKQDRRNAGLDESGKVAKRRSVNPNMHALVVFVQMGLQGERRYRVAKIKTETQVDMRALGPQFCTRDSVLVTDQADAYLDFAWQFEDHHQVNHSKQFVNPEGMHTNLAEGFFSCIRRAQAGAWHRMSIQHLELYGWEFAWRQSLVGASNEMQLHDLLRRLLSSGRSTRFVDYWQKRPGPRRPRPDPADEGSAVEVPISDIPKKMGRPAKDSMRTATLAEVAEQLGLQARSTADPANA